MAHSRRLPKLHTDCIPYIEENGHWQFIGRSYGMYWFKGLNGRKTMTGNDKIPFTLTELRHAYENGW